MRSLRKFLPPLVLALLCASPLSATVIERVVAVIGDRAILLSDLRERALPFLVQIHQSVPTGAQRNAAISQLYKTLIEKLVDEELEQRAAIQAKISVSAKEIDEALERVASQNNLTVEKLLIEAQRSGLTATSYREELRRQLLQTKLINIRLQGRIRVSEDDLRSAYRKLVLEEREKLPFEAAWIFVQLGPGASPADARAKRKQAEDVARAAKGGDFSALARRFSEDPRTREKGGSLGTTQLQQVPTALRRVYASLDVGETSGVVTLPGGYAVLKVLSREETSLPEYDEARAELGQRVYLEKMTQARRSWLDTLRRQQHVEVRL